MTRRQRELLDYIKAYLAANHGVAPSFEEMAKALNVAGKANVFRMLNALEDQGVIRRDHNRARRIEVIADSPEYERGYRAGYAAGCRARVNESWSIVVRAA